MRRGAARSRVVAVMVELSGRATSASNAEENTLQERYFGHEHVTKIDPPRGWRALDLRELWAYRELLAVLTIRDIKVRYKQTVLGAAWAILQPFMTMVVFSIFFGHLAKMPSDGYPYPVFVYSALVPWTFFANAITSSTNSLVGSAHLISKVYFPRLIIPFSAIGAGLVDFAVASSILLAMMLFYGVGWSLNLLMAPVLLLGVVFIAVGAGTCLSALTASYRDFRYVLPFMVQFWMFVTPVVYPASLVPTQWRWLIFLNPMSGLIEGFRAVFLGKAFDFFGLTISAGVAMSLLLVGIAYFERVERRFADII
jgi:homopolymeric O-antigen transport system permease protein